jgi:hypothetical protein
MTESAELHEGKIKAMLEVGVVVELLLSMCKALGSVPSTKNNAILEH